MPVARAHRTTEPTGETHEVAGGFMRPMTGLCAQASYALVSVKVNLVTPSSLAQVIVSLWLFRIILTI